MFFVREACRLYLQNIIFLCPTEIHPTGNQTELVAKQEKLVGSLEHKLYFPYIGSNHPN